MGTVEWSELLRWVPCDPQANPGLEAQTTDHRESSVATLQPDDTTHQHPVRAVEPGKLTLASL